MKLLDSGLMYGMTQSLHLKNADPGELNYSSSTHLMMNRLSTKSSPIDLTCPIHELKTSGHVSDTDLCDGLQVVFTTYGSKLPSEWHGGFLNALMGRDSLFDVMIEMSEHPAITKAYKAVLFQIATLLKEKVTGQDGIIYLYFGRPNDEPHRLDGVSFDFNMIKYNRRRPVEVIDPRNSFLSFRISGDYIREQYALKKHLVRDIGPYLRHFTEPRKE